MAFDLRITKSEKNKIAEELSKEKATNIALRYLVFKWATVFGQQIKDL